MGVAYDIDERLGVLEIKKAKPRVRERMKEAKEAAATGKKSHAKVGNWAEHMFTLDNGLTPEQESYARARAFGLDKLDAIRFATNGKTNTAGAATNMEKKYPLVVKRINELSAQVSQRVVERLAIDKGWVMERLKQVAERCMQAEPVMVNGEPTGEYKFDSAGANRALELIGRELRMFQTNVNVNHTTVNEVPADQLLSLAHQLAAEVGIIDGTNLITNAT